MKKILISLLMALMLCSLAVFGVACSTNLGPKPELDIDDAQEALEDEDYYVKIYEEEGEPEFESRLYAVKGDDYIEIYWCNDKQTAMILFDTTKKALETRIGQIELQMKMIENKLDKYEDDLDSDEIDDLEDELKELKKELKDYKEDYAYGIDGKVVWYGTADAVKDSK